MKYTLVLRIVQPVKIVVAKPDRVIVAEQVLYGKNGQPFTTIDAINAALGLKASGEREGIDIL